MQRRDFLHNTLAFGATRVLPGIGLASGFFGNLPQGPLTSQFEEIKGRTITMDEAAEILVAEWEKGNYKDCPPLIRAIRLGQVETVVLLVRRQGVDIEQRWRKNCTPLHWACNLSALERVKRVHFYDPDIETRNGEELGGYDNYKDSVELLDSSGIDWRSQIQDDGSPIHLSGRIARRQIARFLVVSGADLEARNDWGGTFLHFAARTSDIEFMQYLFRLGVDRDAKDKFGINFVHDAAQFSDVSMMRFLVKSGIDIHDRDKYGGRLLCYASRNLDTSVKKYLIELGLEPEGHGDVLSQEEVEALLCKEPQV